jgi:hypothetical protein
MSCNMRCYVRVVNSLFNECVPALYVLQVNIAYVAWPRSVRVLQRSVRFAVIYTFRLDQFAESFLESLFVVVAF